MAYSKKDKRKIVADIKEAIEHHELTFLYQIFAFVACCQETGTNILKELGELETIKGLLGSQKTLKKIAALKRWEQSENATLEVAYFKLLGIIFDLKNNYGYRDKREVETDNKHDFQGINLMFNSVPNLPENEEDISNLLEAGDDD